MTVVADVSIEANDFLLGRIVAECPAISVGIERVVPGREGVMPYLWVYGEEWDAFEDELSDTAGVYSAERLDELAGRALYRVEWAESAEELVSGIVDVGATILRATSDEAWSFRIRFEDRSGLGEFDRHCTAHGVDYRLERVSSLSAVSVDLVPYGLTDPQYETLRLAVERGYFEVPRKVTFADLSEDLDVSVQAISERVRRGTGRVLEAVLFQPVEGEFGD